MALLDLHAEATGEKLAVAHIFDGSFSAVFGTHTHVPTADTQILPKGTGYVTDLGATAPTGGILGVKTEVICTRAEQKLAASYQVAQGPVRAEGVLFDIDPPRRPHRGVTRNGTVFFAGENLLEKFCRAGNQALGSAVYRRRPEDKVFRLVAR